MCHWALARHWYFSLVLAREALSLAPSHSGERQSAEWSVYCYGEGGRYDTQHNNIQNNDNQLKRACKMTLSITMLCLVLCVGMLNVAFYLLLCWVSWYAECRYAEGRGAWVILPSVFHLSVMLLNVILSFCWGHFVLLSFYSMSFIILLCVFQLNVILLIVILPSAFHLSDILLNVILLGACHLSIILLSVIRLSVILVIVILLSAILL